MFRILCLDGGGIKGVFTAAALARIEDQTKRRIVDYFDLMCGTSTGGILAIGLSMGLSAAELLEFYRKRGPVIFPTMSLVERSAGLLRQLFVGPKLSHEILRRELSAVLKDSKFGEARCRLAIPSYDAVRGRIYVFKTPHDARFVNDVDRSAVDVALATSAAPTYFAAASASRDGRFVDGGVWANSPVMVALVEAVSFLGIPLGEIDILSLGTTTEPFSIAKNETASALKWNVGLINLMFEAQAEAAQAQAQLLLKGRVHRVNFVSTANRFSLDNASERAIGDLTNLGWTEVEKKEHSEVILRRFVNGVPTEQYKPSTVA
ncbi:patatin-like phospholipase family protein [Bradyrhizobium sp. AUGA SZCCT0240]|uniref:CBASS cGAMP-activated phospholipase n=1 Tax=Bradyrhizobium sp. AUGA SZCCT0240 TaxID=2807669 RepID=UPI001BA46040|nr:CBASS cGAMP-activated phospholipase [Bradyrhizobium sp. AUGA SZCCT0240]MBR1255183.1 patatin-like phospholipase family protein [Bradyrhizobium sp. AUGA SZCCT0240]